MVLIAMNAVHDMRLDWSTCPVGSTTVVYSLKEAGQSWVPTQPFPGFSRSRCKTARVAVEDEDRCRSVTHELKGRLEASDHLVYQSREPKYQRLRYGPTIWQFIDIPPSKVIRRTYMNIVPAVLLTIEFGDLFCRQPVPYPPSLTSKFQMTDWERSQATCGRGK
ncbi:hypothetical protein N7475_003785, partial [Penicillium sp. IBT 31633x]